MRLTRFTLRAMRHKEMTMKKFAIITAAALVAASVSSAYAQGVTGPGDQTKQHKAMKSDMTTGSATRSSRKPMAGNNAELKGDSATSAGGANSLSNTNNPGGMGNNAGPPMK
jgi:2-methylcitrate dehydratase PrpD